MPEVQTTTHGTSAILTPADALRRLKEGNVRFLNDLRHERDPFFDLDQGRNGQSPFVAVVACMDSRVSTEMVFDLGIGDMFSLRVAGNVMAEEIVGSLEYAAAVVGSKLIVVLGHSQCGAVKAACDHVKMGRLTSVLAQIEPAVQLVHDVPGEHNGNNPEFVQAVSHLNVRLAVEQLPQRSPVLKELIDKGKLAVVGAMYEVGTGLVRFVDNV